MRYPDQVTGRKRGNKKKKSVKICFSEPGDADERNGAEGGGGVAGGGPDDRTPEGEEGGQQEEKAAAAVGSLESECLEEVVCQLAQLCLVHVSEERSETHLVFLSLLLRSFHTPRVFTVSPPALGASRVCLHNIHWLCLHCVTSIESYVSQGVSYLEHAYSEGQKKTRNNGSAGLLWLYY